MSDPAELDALLDAVDTGAFSDALAVLAWVAGREVPLPADELNGARRRALLVHANGGDLRREPAVDDPAVKGLAAELHTDERRDLLGAGVDHLVTAARLHDIARDAILYLAADPDLAWRLFALGLLAEELDE